MSTVGNAQFTILALTRARKMRNIRRWKTLTKNLYVVTALALCLFSSANSNRCTFHRFYSFAGWSQRPKTISSSLWWLKMENTAAQRHVQYIQPNHRGKKIKSEKEKMKTLIFVLHNSKRLTRLKTPKCIKRLDLTFRFIQKQSTLENHKQLNSQKSKREKGKSLVK